MVRAGEGVATWPKVGVREAVANYEGQKILLGEGLILGGTKIT